MKHSRAVKVKSITFTLLAALIFGLNARAQQSTNTGAENATSAPPVKKTTTSTTVTTVTRPAKKAAPAQQAAAAEDAASQEAAPAVPAQVAPAPNITNAPKGKASKESTGKPTVPSASVAAPATPSQAPSGRAWTLRDSIQAGLNYSPQVRFAREKITENEAILKGYYSQLFPTISGDAGWTVNKDALKGGQALFDGNTYNRYSVGVSIDQPLYRGGLTTNALQAQRKTLDSLKLALDIAERDQTAAVTRAFYQLLVAQRTVEIERRIKQIQVDFLKTAQSRYRIGREELLSVLQIKTDLALIEPDVVRSENARSLAAANFANLLGIQNEGEILIQAPTTPLRFKYLEDAHLEKQVVADTPEVRQSALAIEISEATKESILSVNWPTLDAIGSIGRNAYKAGDIFNSDTTSYSFGLKLSVPLFTGLSSFHQRDQLSSQVEQARISEKALRDTNALQRVQTDQDLDNAKVLLKASEEAQAQANEAVRVATRTYSLGTSTYIQVSQSQTRFAQAEISFEQAQYEMVNVLLNYAVAHAIPMKDVLPLFEKSAL